MRYTTHVDNILGIMADSSTEPCDAILNTGDRVIIKLINNKEGNLALVNEYICYKLAECVCLPMPESGIALVDSNTIDTNHVISSSNYGPCFFSKRINHATLVKTSIIKRLSNKDDFFNILIFDHLVYNKDRNLGNLLTSMKKTSLLYAIDHTHVFKNQCIWDKHCLLHGIRGNDYLDFDIMNYNAETYNVFLECMTISEKRLNEIAGNYQNIISKEMLKNIMLSIPNEWIPKADDIQALIEYLLYRTYHLQDIVSVILKHKRR